MSRYRNKLETMSFIYTGVGPIIEYQFRISEGSNCVRWWVTWCWSVCRKSGILFCTNAYITRCAAILDGSLAPQSRLPPSRDLAGELGVSRNTILTTYEQLLAEGYVVSRRGSGTFVAQTAPESSLTAKGQQENSSIAAPTVHLSRRGQHLLGQVSASPRQWGRLYRRAGR